MNLSDTFYIALCMTVLILGVVYWFWTQNQYTQRKLNLLENIVYEMKSTMGTGPPGGFELTGHSNEPVDVSATGYIPAPSSVLGDDEDLLHEELHTEVMSSNVDEDDGIPDIAPSDMPEEEDDGINAEAIADDLQPGGVGSGVKEIAATSNGTVFDGMTLKQLKTLASQHNISGAAGMRKHELIASLRAKIPADSTF